MLDIFVYIFLFHEGEGVEFKRKGIVMRSRLSNFNWANLLLGIVAMIAAMAAFRDPAANLLALTVFFGVTALVRGIIQIYAKFALKKNA